VCMTICVSRARNCRLIHLPCVDHCYDAILTRRGEVNLSLTGANTDKIPAQRLGPGEFTPCVIGKHL
jgi:hypothetical protein